MFETDNEPIGKIALALGSFDGLHLGHKAILESAKTEAEKSGVEPAVMLFDVHPRSVIDGKAPPLLLSDKRKEELLESFGFRIIKAKFASIRDLSPEEFLGRLMDEFDVEAICCGFNYRFGRGGSGDTKALRAALSGSGVRLLVSEPVTVDGDVVSSTKIRSLISSGDVEKANRMLGRPFSFELEVVGGDRRGRTLGFPTINQVIPEWMICPKYGVYASAIELEGRLCAGATNIGIRPTIGTKTFGCETHIIGYSGDLYRKTVEVKLLKYLRGEIDCGSIDALAVQLGEDVRRAGEVFGKYGKA